MLVLSRKPGQRIVVGDAITITIVEARSNRVRIGIDAPGRLKIAREELAGRRQQTPTEPKPAPRRETAS